MPYLNMVCGMFSTFVVLLVKFNHQHPYFGADEWSSRDYRMYDFIVYMLSNGQINN
jgi:hypothetical protein